MSAKPRTTDKHFLIYYKRGTGTFIVTEPLPWARENQAHFPNYNFTSRVPTTNGICEYLVKEYKFKKQVDKSGVKAYTNLDPDLNLDK
jgi:hypothetical protein